MACNSRSEKPSMRFLKPSAQTTSSMPDMPKAHPDMLFRNGPCLANPLFELLSCRRVLSSVRGRPMAVT
jgi:hypothetical protein